jgi:hypothetical protein
LIEIKISDPLIRSASRGITVTVHSSRGITVTVHSSRPSAARQASVPNRWNYGDSAFISDSSRVAHHRVGLNALSPISSRRYGWLDRFRQVRRLSLPHWRGWPKVWTQAVRSVAGRVSATSKATPAAASKQRTPQSDTYQIAARRCSSGSTALLYPVAAISAK